MRDDGVVEVSAEKGYLREFGNLVFHFALLALLVAIAAGKLWGYEGTRILVADGQQGLCNTSTAVYDSFRGGNLVDGTDLTPFCITIDSFSAKYLQTGQPDMYSAKLNYQTGSDLDTGREESATVKVNDPLRIAGDRIYLLGHGYAPTFTVRFRDGESRTQTVPFTPNETVTLLSSGAARFDTPAGLYPNPDDRRKNQIALEGIFARPPPTAARTTRCCPRRSRRAGPGRRHPHLRGRHGPRHRSATERLLARPEPHQPGSAATAGHHGWFAVGYQPRGRPVDASADGTTVSFDGYKQWASLQVSHDPAQQYVLIAAIAMLGGLIVSLLVKRRRVWARVSRHRRTRRQPTNDLQ